MSDGHRPHITSVSVIIANLNCPILDQTLDGLYAQVLDPAVSVEIIVVGRDEPGCLRRFPQVIFVETDCPVGPAEARNIALRRARGELVAILDADCVPDGRWLSEMIAAHDRHPNRAVIGGSIRIDADSLWALADNLSSFHAYLPSRPAATYPMFPTCNVSMRREAFDQVGLFDEARLLNEDTDWMMRARRKDFELHFWPPACVWHKTQRRSLRAVLSHARQWGYHSIVDRQRYSDLLPFPFAMRRWWSLIGAAPLIAVAVTAGVFVRNPATWRHLWAAPIVATAKLAWCWGAARRLWEQATLRYGMLEQSIIGGKD